MEFLLDKVEEYTTDQLQKYLDEIEEYWVKTNELHSMTDLLEINRELTLREFREGAV
jgi:predicted house-cleaning noncanonical NTP pyrophosphatase (MazG superfamily)